MAEQPARAPRGRWRQRVVVVGGGFGGLATTRGLKRENVDVLLIDRTNHHLFQPLLYQVAMAALSPAEIALPIRSLLSGQKNAEVMLGEVTSVNLRARRLETTSGPVDYHHLVLAAGSLTNFFGRDDWAASATGLKSLDDAVEMRRRVLLALEHAEQEGDPERRRSLLTFAVIGGGPTGVELAGALSELSRTTVKRDFKHVRPDEISVVLVEGSGSVLRSFQDRCRERAVRQLIALGVDVRCDARVTNIDESGLTIEAGGTSKRIPAATILWGAGVRGTELARSLEGTVKLDPSGRVLVDASLNLPGYDDVFCIGDMAACTDANGVKVPGVAPAAAQQGRFVARQIARRLQGSATLGVFRYRDKGNLATIGRKAAVAEFGRLQLSGFVAWLLWLCVHICFLVGFRNRYVVLVQWFWHYFTYRGGAQLITGSTNPKDELIRPRPRAKPVNLPVAQVTVAPSAASR
jgi:NADH:ubiquinone reductase (H+-translocating)